MCNILDSSSINKNWKSYLWKTKEISRKDLKVGILCRNSDPVEQLMPDVRMPPFGHDFLKNCFNLAILEGFGGIE